MLDPNGINIWWCVPAETDALIYDSWHRKLLTPEERERCDRLVRSEDRHNFLISRWMIRTALSQVIPVSPELWVFESDRNGRPFVAAPESGRDLEFSLAHTRGLVACAASRGRRIGIDVEAVRETPEIMEIARRHFAAEEIRFLEARSGTDQVEAFCSLWTLKEALSKALGLGLRIPLDTIEFHLPGSGAPEVTFRGSLREETAHWQFFFPTDPGPGWRMAVAVRDPAQEPRTPRVTRLDPFGESG